MRINCNKRSAEIADFRDSLLRTVRNKPAESQLDKAAAIGICTRGYLCSRGPWWARPCQLIRSAGVTRGQGIKKAQGVSPRPRASGFQGGLAEELKGFVLGAHGSHVVEELRTESSEESEHGCYL